MYDRVTPPNKSNLNHHLNSNFKIGSVVNEERTKKKTNGHCCGNLTIIYVDDRNNTLNVVLGA